MLALLEGPSVYIHLDPRREGVVVPKWFTQQPQLVLQVGLNMAVRIPDLDVGDDGVSCTLSFNRSPFWCHLPWSAVYGLVGEDGRGMIWPDDVPEELSGPPRARPKLEAVPSQPAPEPAAKPSPDEPAAPAKKGRAPSKRKTAKASPHEGDAAPKPRARRPKAVPVVETETAALAPAPAAPPSAAAARPSVSPSGSRPKRELPPYLRIVK